MGLAVELLVESGSQVIPKLDHEQTWRPEGEHHQDGTNLRGCRLRAGFMRPAIKCGLAPEGIAIS